jgi:hypothetical protein
MASRNERSLDSAPEPGRIGEEIAKIPYEPLLPIEKRLIAWSLVLGVALMGILFWISQSFFGVTS